MLLSCLYGNGLSWGEAGKKLSPLLLLFDAELLARWLMLLELAILVEEKTLLLRFHLFINTNQNT